jgi:hypothetical protein
MPNKSLTTSLPEKRFTSDYSKIRRRLEEKRRMITYGVQKMSFEQKKGLAEEYLEKLKGGKMHFVIGSETYKKNLPKWMHLSSVDFYVSLGD